MPEEPQNDPNVPDPKKPWCPECEEHVDLAAKQQSISYSSASFTGRYSHRCKSCKTKVFVAGTSAALRHPYLKRLVSVSKITSYFLIGVGLVFFGYCHSNHHKRFQHGTPLTWDSVVYWRLCDIGHYGWVLCPVLSLGFKTRQNEKKVARLGTRMRLHGGLMLGAAYR